MISRGRENATQHDNIEFRLGEIEHLPVADNAVDAIISNCVINLSPEKEQVFTEAFRVLRPGGRLAIADVVMTAELPASVRADLDSFTECVAGASTVPALEDMLMRAGFEDVSITPKDDSRSFITEWSDTIDLAEYLVSAEIKGTKPVE